MARLAACVWGIGLLAGGLACGDRSPKAAVERTDAPNVVVIIADDLGWNDVGYHGSELSTPAIDRLASEGVRFSRFYAYPSCRPSRASLLTGLSASRAGVENRGSLRLDWELLPGIFGRAGYQTWLVGKWGLGARSLEERPEQRGFDAFQGLLGGAIDYFTHRNVDDGSLDWWNDGEPLSEEGYATDLLGRRAVSWIEERDRTRPFLLVLSFNAVHGPLQAPTALMERHAAIEDPDRRAFAAMLESMDAAIADVLAVIDRDGLTRDTLVVFLSDNGGSSKKGASNAPLRGGKINVYEGGIRVPAVARWPGVLPPNATSDQLIWIADLLPTLASAAGIPLQTSEPLDGVDLWPALRLGETTPRPPFSLRLKGLSHRALVSGRYKLIELRPSGRFQLYDVIDDPSEKTNLAARKPALVAELRAQLAALDGATANLQRD